jgi:hypothetical protein
MTLTATNAHNLLPAHDILGGQRYADTFITADNAAVEVARLLDSATTRGALRFLAAVIIGAGNNGHIGEVDAFDCIDHVCSLLAVAA